MLLHSPDLIDLAKYEAELLECARAGSPLWPPHPIPHHMGQFWTAGEMREMIANRREAELIYKRIRDAGADSLPLH